WFAFFVLYCVLRILFLVFFLVFFFFFFSSRRRHTRSDRDWSSDVCSSDLGLALVSAAIALLCVGALTMLVRDRWHPPEIKSAERSEERRVGKECRSRGAPDH